MEIYYCSKCQVRVSTYDIENNRGVSANGDIYCRKCARSLGIEIKKNNPGRKTISSSKGSQKKPSVVLVTNNTTPLIIVSVFAVILAVVVIGLVISKKEEPVRVTSQQAEKIEEYPEDIIPNQTLSYLKRDDGAPPLIHESIKPKDQPASLPAQPAAIIEPSINQPAPQPQPERNTTTPPVYSPPVQWDSADLVPIMTENFDGPELPADWDRTGNLPIEISNGALCIDTQNSGGWRFIIISLLI